MSLSAEDLFEQLKDAVDRAVARESFGIVNDAAENAGMTGGRKDQSMMTLGFTYEYLDAAGGTVTLVVKSWDTSSPFQSKPDRNKMTVELVRDGKVLQAYSSWYED